MMLPRLTELEPTDAQARALVNALQRAGFAGDIEVNAAARLAAATDNSVYQIVPQAVVFPRTTDDVAILMRLGQTEPFRTLTFTPRGAGTGTNGQALTDGVVVDVSRHMNAILGVDLAGASVTVQPGVVLDQLNAVLKPDGVFFAPNLSPSSRATLGGMIATDASGKGSRVYGKTSDHLVSVEIVLIDGSIWRAERLSADGLAEVTARDDLIGHVHRVVDGISRDHADTIAAGFPELQRFVTGYNLKMVRDAEGFDLCRVIAGSEGTLGVVTEATLRLTPIPAARRLVVFKYGRFEDALGSAQALVKADPGAIETIDETVLELARDDVIFDAVAGVLADADGAPRTRTINLVELEGASVDGVDAEVERLLDAVTADPASFGSPLGWVVADDEPTRLALWDLRKKGVGLLGSRPGARKPVAFVEDTVVPPARLPEYVAAFREILDKEGLFYGMFGHVDVGCLHVRPALDLQDDEDAARLRRISDRVHALTMSFGGVIWGEHGKGFRSQYSPEVFGEPLFSLMCEVKGAFDPDHRLNPGKVATPPADRAALVTVDAPLRGTQDRQIAGAERELFEVAIACNGNGACFNVDPDDVMCPSAKVTRDRIHSPKGRAGVTREWLRQLAARGYQVAAVKPWGGLKSCLTWPVRAWHTLRRRSGRYDFSNEVYGAMSGCLACKACATQCPVKVDVPSFRARFLDAYHRRYLRPPRDHLVASLEGGLRPMSWWPGLTNFLLRRRFVRWLTRRAVGMVDVPPVATRSLAAGLRARGTRTLRMAQLDAVSRDERAVILVQDAFTRFYEPEVVLAAWDVLKALGFSPHVAPYAPSGKGEHVKGFMRRFARRARRTGRLLTRLASTGAPLVGLEPAVVLAFRDEYREALGEGASAFHVALLQEFLAAQPLDPRAMSGERPPVRLFSHCTEQALVTRAAALWRDVFGRVGVELAAERVGCCGMSGAFGHEAIHEAESKGIFAMSWAGKLPDGSDDEGWSRVTATGYSCRSQVKRMTGRRMRHPVEVLRDVLVG